MAPSIVTAAPPSPRSRRHSSITPLTVAMPTPSYDESSRPSSPTFHRARMFDLQRTLYGSQDKDEIRELVEEEYDQNATFENPLAMARGQTQIADIFCLLDLLPGSRWSELGDVAEAESYDSTRLVVITHTLHCAILPFLSSQPQHPQSSALHPAHPCYSSIPSTPFPAAEGSSPFSPSLPSLSPATWPVAYILNALRPKSIASALTTVHLKIHTKLIYNEQNKIISHEDTWGLKETIEGFLPLMGFLYALNRYGFGLAASWFSRTLYRPKGTSEEAQVGKDFHTSSRYNTNANGRTSYFGPGSPIQSRMPTRSPSINPSRTEGLALGGIDKHPVFEREDGHEARHSVGIRFHERLSGSPIAPSMDVDNGVYSL